MPEGAPDDAPPSPPGLATALPPPVAEGGRADAPPPPVCPAGGVRCGVAGPTARGPVGAPLAVPGIAGLGTAEAVAGVFTRDIRLSSFSLLSWLFYSRSIDQFLRYAFFPRQRLHALTVGF